MAVAVTPLEQYTGRTQDGVNTLDANFLKAGSCALVYAGLAGGTANAITVTIPLAISDYYIGMRLEFIATNTNSGSVTLTATTPLGTLNPILVTDQGGSLLGSGVIAAGALVSTVLCQDSLGAQTLRLELATSPVSSVFGRVGAVTAANGDYSIGQITGAGTMAAQNATAIAVTGGTMSGVSGPALAAAWVNFNATTAAILAALNINSVTRTSQGHYTIVFSSAFPSANYSYAFGSTAGVKLDGSKLTTGLSVFIYDPANGDPIDTTEACVTVWHN